VVGSPIPYVLLSPLEFFEKHWATEGKPVIAEIFATRSDGVKIARKRQICLGR